MMRALAILLALLASVSSLHAARTFASPSRIDFGPGPTSGAFSVAAWIYPTTSGTITNQYIVCVHNGDENNVFMILWIEAGGLALNLNPLARRGGTISQNNLYHVAATYDGGSTTDAVKLYINGTEVSYSFSSGSGTAIAWGGRLSVGGRIYDNNRNFAGTIDLVGMWDEALSAGEISVLAAGAHPTTVRPRALILASDLGRTVTDIVGGRTVNVTSTTVTDHVRQFRAPE